MAASARSPYFIPSRKRRRPGGRRSGPCPRRDGERGTAQSAGKEEAPGSGTEDDAGEPAEGDLGQSGQNAQNVIGKEGKQKGQHQENVKSLAWITSRYFFRDLSAHQAGDCVSAQAAGQREHQQRAGGDCGKGEQEGDPGAE